MNFSKLISLITLCAFFQASINAQDWTSYQSQQQVNDLVDTGDELLLATDAGLVVVNKTTLETNVFNMANSNLSNNHIQSITQSPDGSAWIGTYDVIMMRFDGNDFQDATPPAHPELNQNMHLYDLKIAPNGDIWMGTSGGIFHRQGQNWSFYDEEEIGPSFFEAWDIEIDENGDVFVASFDVSKFSNGVWSNLTENTDLHGYNSADLFFSASGDLYMAGDLENIGRYDGQQWELLDGFNGLNGAEVIKFTADSDGTIYFNTLNDGIYKLEGTTWTPQADLQATVFDNKTSYFYIDAQGHRWMNRSIHFSVNRNGSIESTTIATHTIETNNIHKVKKGANGKMYILTSSEDNFAVVDTDGQWSFLAKPSPFAGGEFLGDLYALADDDIWLSTSFGLYHYDGSDWTFDGLGNCGSIVMDSQSKMYIQSHDKIFIIDNGNISEYNVDNSQISALFISGIGLDANDNLWIASFDWNGDAAIQTVTADGIWSTYTVADHPAIEQPVGDFHFDNEGNVWVPNNNVGAIKFDGTAFTNPFIGNLDQMTEYDVNDIAIDSEGKLYFAHSYGVTTFFNGEWNDVPIAELPQASVSGATYATFDDDGTLWWASSRYGVFAYSAMTTNTADPDSTINANITIFPNPTSRYATLDFYLSEKANVTIAIYNNLGQLTTGLDLGQLSAGAHQQRINGSDFPKGIYHVQLTMDNKTITKAVVFQ